MSFDVQNKNLLQESACVTAHETCTLHEPVKSIFSIQPNGTDNVIIVPINGENNLIMIGSQHQQPGKCFKTLKLVYNGKQAKK